MIAKKSTRKLPISVKKIIIFSIILILLSGICVLAENTKLSNVKITCSNGSELNVITSKTKVSEILEENHIIVLPDEKVTPNEESEIQNNKKIQISKLTEEEEFIEAAETTTDIEIDDIMEAYSPVIEKIVVENETIPFETILKDETNSSNETSNRVLQEGVEGLREVTYKVKYQNEKEIEKIEISSVIIQEPVDKIVQVKSKVTNRSDGERTDTKVIDNSSKLAAKVEGKTPVVKTMNTSAYTASTCGKSSSSSSYGVTSSGAKAKSWYTIAAGSKYPVGTVVYIPYFKNKPNGGWFIVQDRGGAITNNRIDVYMGTYNECISFGRKNLECYIYK